MSDKLFTLIRDEMVDFRKELMSQNSVKNLIEVIYNILPPMGITKNTNVKEVNF